jgi:Quercetinase C-terminal cupin domain
LSAGDSVAIEQFKNLNFEATKNTKALIFDLGI